MRRVLTEAAATIAVLAAASVYFQLRDSTSPLRLWLDERADELREWSIHARVEDLIRRTEKGGEA